MVTISPQFGLSKEFSLKLMFRDSSLTRFRFTSYVFVVENIAKEKKNE